MPTLKLPVKLDISFGGMFYAVVQTDSIDELPPLEPQNGKLIAALGCQILVSKVDYLELPIHVCMIKNIVLFELIIRCQISNS